jgi:molecular chaperone IbpA
MTRNAFTRFPSFFEFDGLFPAVPQLSSESSSFPHFDLYHIDQEQYVIEMALAGFSKDSIEVTVENNLLTIKGEKVEAELPEGAEYIRKGIAHRAFTKQFALGEYFIVQGAEFRDGVLRISIEKEVPEEKKPKLIPLM